MENVFSSKAARSGVVVLSLLLGVGWYFWNDAQRKKQVYEGRIVNKYEKRKWLRSSGKRGFSRQRRYDYFFDIECADGQTRTVEVLRSLYTSANVGDPVKKVAGESYPRLDTQKARSDREVKEQVFDQTVNGWGGG